MTLQPQKITIRPATAADADTILSFVRALARDENAESEVTADVQQIRKTLFSQTATAHAVICESTGQAIGCAVYFFNYSTWQGKNGLYIEDLYITPEFRNQGAGKIILKHLARLALEAGCGRMEWSVLDWNSGAIRFYNALGAKPQAEWIRYRLTGKTLSDLAGFWKQEASLKDQKNNPV